MTGSPYPNVSILNRQALRNHLQGTVYWESISHFDNLWSYDVFTKSDNISYHKILVEHFWAICIKNFPFSAELSFLIVILLMQSVKLIAIQKKNVTIKIEIWKISNFHLSSILARYSFAAHGEWYPGIQSSNIFTKCQFVSYYEFLYLGISENIEWVQLLNNLKNVCWLNAYLYIAGFFDLWVFCNLGFKKSQLEHKHESY